MAGSPPSTTRSMRRPPKRQGAGCRRTSPRLRSRTRVASISSPADGEGSDRARSSLLGLRARGVPGGSSRVFAWRGTGGNHRAAVTPSARRRAPPSLSRLIEIGCCRCATKGEHRNVLGLWRLERREIFSRQAAHRELAWLLRTLAIRALAQHAGSHRHRCARLMGAGGLEAAFAAWSRRRAARRTSRAYPSFSPPSRRTSLSTLGDRSDWLAEWKWAASARNSAAFGALSLVRGEERVTDRFPDLSGLGGASGRDVLDGEVLAFSSGAPMRSRCCSGDRPAKSSLRRSWRGPASVHGL